MSSTTPAAKSGDIGCASRASSRDRRAGEPVRAGGSRSRRACAALIWCLLAAPIAIRGAAAQTVADGSDAGLGKLAREKVLDLIGQRFAGLDPKITSLRKAEGSWICGAVDVKNRDGIYTGERGFVIDLDRDFLGRVPDGPELLSPRAAGFSAMEEIRQRYFAMCLD